jgi:photosystem II stability/assembly factor-like uncharacterized protein
MRVIRFTLLLAVPAFAAAQSAAPAAAPANPPWQMQESGTTAGLRGIDSVDGTVAWASGTGGTVLKTIDGGAHWTKCVVPDAATDGGTLDFRGVQAWDADTAIVMASGPGDKSRLYKTTDGCISWKTLFTDPDKDGFFNAIAFQDELHGYLLGDPVNGRFVLRSTSNGGSYWPSRIQDQEWNVAYPTEAAFAASNSSLFVAHNAHAAGPVVWFGTGGAQGSRVVMFWLYGGGDVFTTYWRSAKVPITSRNASSGIFSIAFRDRQRGITVGGDYTKPSESAGTAAWSTDGGQTWSASATPPHGFRSAVQWSEALKLWITVGTNGSDISSDDGKTWQPLDGGNWNALSLPFVVGPNGRIARMNPAAFPAPGVTKGTAPAQNPAPAR